MSFAHGNRAQFLVAAGPVDAHAMHAGIDPELVAELIRVDASVIEQNAIAILESIDLDA